MTSIIGNGSTARVLLIDDDEAIADTLSDILDDEGYSVVTAMTGLEGLEKAAEKKPDIALIDIRLPDMEGPEVMARLQELHPRIACIIITGYASMENAIQALELGAKGYFTKPLVMPDVLGRLRDIMDNIQLVHDLGVTEERYRMLFDRANDAVFVYELDGDGIPRSFAEVNEVACRRLGYEREELLALPPGSIDVTDSSGIPPDALERLKQERKAIYECEHVTQDGRTFPVEISSHLFVLDGVPTVLALARDITERKRTEVLMKQQARAEVFTILASALPVFASNVPIQARDTMVRTFSERFERNVRPRFRDHIDRMRRSPYAKAAHKKGSYMLLDGYLVWLSELFAGMGARTTTSARGPSGTLSILSCPWKSEAQGNPIFCLICRAMVTRSFTWTGSCIVRHKSTIAQGSGTCTFELTLNDHKAKNDRQVREEV